MALSSDLTLVERALDALEELEVRGLVWGLIDNALTPAEVEQSLRSVLHDPTNAELRSRADCTVATALDLRDELVRWRMLFPTFAANGDQTGWRTRMAEGVRLIAQVRQLFPKHKGDEWTGGATLVADYRFLRRPRRYPKRDISAGDARTQFSEVVQDPTLLSAISHWLDQMPTGGALARFQIDSATRIFQTLQGKTCTGTLVAAGTGSGKTLAFYLPALTWLASRRAAEAVPSGVRILALYPRNELLKDQLSEVYEQCRRFDALIGRVGGRPLRVGVLFGETPWKINSDSRLRGWSRTARGWICPFFRCPSCDGEIQALDIDVKEQVQRLICNTCHLSVDHRTFAYTREVICQDPPDILFTSVEMLNRHLPSVDMRHVFGVGPRAPRAPDLVLMDEVHLYAGTYGAQVAYLIRRWRAASGRGSSFVGLSATITEGRSFFANLTGLSESVVQEVTPQEQDMVEEGAEYLLALRGDPVSQAALLSTTIQTLMLGSRLLDPRGTFDKQKMPFFGWRAFAFTDQLDAANRLYRDLLDAEGRYPSGEVNAQRHPNGGLAHLRESIDPPGRRYLRGQDWRVLTEIGHRLSERLQVTRTTSYDSGVSTSSQVVVATAALEVGFDDAAVGLVVQHKAPRDIASFLQRKGRAGRTRHTRPWTVVVLSDYGRDRMAYQAYDQLFDPELPARQLPLANRYVQRMQAVYALLDELGDRTQATVPPGRVWQDLKGPAQLDARSGWTDEDLRPIRLILREPLPQSATEWKTIKGRAVREAPRRFVGAKTWAGTNWLEQRLKHGRLLGILSAYIDSEEHATQLSRRLADRLGLSIDEVTPLLWNQPRPVLLGAIPTAVRRLATNWRADGKLEADYQSGHPLPEFVPANLFDDLSLPEMRLIFPEDARTGLDFEFLSVQQGLGEFAPGKVSRRFNDPLWLGFEERVLFDILSMSDEGPVEIVTDVSGWYDVDRQPEFFEEAQGRVQPFLALRPRSARLERADRSEGLRVNDTSNAQMIWSSHLHAPNGGDTLYPPSHIGISRLIDRLHAHTHARQNAALVRRYACGSRAEIQITRGQDKHRVTVNCRFELDTQPCGVGFDLETDALVLVLNLPTSIHDQIEWTPERVRAARAARYNFEAQRESSFVEVVPNPFLRTWIAQIFQIAAILRAREQNEDLRAALDGLASGQHAPFLLGILPAIFQAPDEDGGENRPDRLRQSLVENLQRPEVLVAVREVARVLVDPIDAGWEDWLSLTIRATLGAACLEGIQQSCPQVDTDSLVVDVDPGIQEDGSRPGTHQIWISEVNPGGNGLIEQVIELLTAQPDAFFRHVEAALGPQDFEYSSAQLRQVVAWLGGPQADPELVDQFARVRGATTATESQLLFGELRAALTHRGQSVFHSYAVALGMRLLRPQTPSDLDRLIDSIYSEWEDLEKGLGIEIDVRVICALHSGTEHLDGAFTTLGIPLPTENRRHWRFSVLMGILWARGHALRAVGLPHSNRFSSGTVATERILLTQWLTPRPAPIDASRADWLDLAREQLRTYLVATIGVRASEARQWLPIVSQAMVTEPIQFDYLNLYARLTEVKRHGEWVEWTFAIPESA